MKSFLLFLFIFLFFIPSVLSADSLSVDSTSSSPSFSSRNLSFNTKSGAWRFSCGDFHAGSLGRMKSLSFLLDSYNFSDESLWGLYGLGWFGESLSLFWLYDSHPLVGGVVESGGLRAGFGYSFSSEIDNTYYLPHNEREGLEGAIYKVSYSWKWLEGMAKLSLSDGGVDLLLGGSVKWDVFELKFVQGHELNARGKERNPYRGLWVSMDSEAVGFTVSLIYYGKALKSGTYREIETEFASFLEIGKVRLVSRQSAFYDKAGYWESEWSIALESPWFYANYSSDGDVGVSVRFGRFWLSFDFPSSYAISLSFVEEDYLFTFRLGSDGKAGGSFTLLF